MEYKYNLNLWIITKYYLFFLVMQLNIFSINCHGHNCDKKIISESNKCVEKCPNDTYELGDYCYYQCPANKNMENDYTKLHKSCKCKKNYYLYQKEKKGKDEYDCVEICPTQFYDYESKKCVDDCGNKLTHIDKDDMGQEKQKRCSKKCLPSEFLKKDENTCLDSCNFYLKEKETKVCMENCDDGYIYSAPDSQGRRECVLQCNEGDVIAFSPLHPDGKKKKQCFNSGEVAKFYKYKDIYFQNCEDTLEIFNSLTYKYKNETTNEEICVDQCSKTDKQFTSLEKECIDNCGDNFYYNKYCLKECFRFNYNMDYSTIDNSQNVISELIGDKNLIANDTVDFNQFPEEKECLEKCPFGTLTDKDEKKCYLSTCPKGKFINSNHECIQECESGVTEQNVILKSIKRMGETGPDEAFHKITKQFCLNSCDDKSPYYYNNKCYNVPCKEMNKYSTYDYPFICYDSCEEVKGYNYQKDFICHKTQLRELEDISCPKYYYFETVNLNNKVKKCTENCYDTNFQYIKGNECTNDCNDYIIENVQSNKAGCFEYFNECINKNKNFIFIDNDNDNENGNEKKICVDDCGSGNYTIENYYTTNLHYCSPKCPNDYPYKNEIDNGQKKCVAFCTTPFYDEETKTCNSTCEDPKPYHFNNSKECVSSCFKNNRIFYVMNDEKICHYSCIGNYKFISNNHTSDKLAYKCVENCNNNGDYKYYYEDKKFCESSCSLYKSENGNDQYQCVYRCEEGQKVINKTSKYYCKDQCENDYGTFIEKRTIPNLSLMEVCVQNCQSKYSSSTTKYCYDECPTNESYIYNDKCYQKCPGGTYVDELDKKCQDNSCPNNTRQFIEEIDGVYICRATCPGDKFIDYDDNTRQKGKCLNICPSNKKFIKNKIECTNGCNDLYILKIAQSTTEPKYDIFNCSENCGDKFTLNDSYNCEDECPGEYYESPDRKCYKGGCQSNTIYPFTIDLDNKKLCAKKCNDTQPYYYESDKICKANCGEDIHDFDNKCVKECTNQIYKYLDTTNNIKKCVAECPESKKYFDDNEKNIHTCVDKCEAPYNYVKDNKCLNQSQFSCNSNQFEKTNEVTNEVECVLKCNDNQFYYENKRVCIPDCEDTAHFKIQGTQICITEEECPPPYFTYNYDNTIANSSYKSNMCVKKCPTEKPFDDNRKCVVMCPQGGNKYHLYGETNCRSQCPQNTVIDGDVCTSMCPDKKYLDYFGKECITECDSTAPYYVEGVNQCIKKCDVTKYLYEGNKCVSSCSENKYKVGNSCEDKCPQNQSFVYEHECLEKCPGDFPIHKTVKIDETTEVKMCLKECGDHLYPDGECKNECNETYPYYNYDNGTCLEKCPYFYVDYPEEDQEKEKKKCYNKCPSTYPYYIKNPSFPIECSKTCDPPNFINITNKECQIDCELKNFTDNNINYCLNDCDDLGLLKFGGKCIKKCEDLGQNYFLNPETNECECENLYYIDGNEKICLAVNINDCSQNTNDYKIRKNGAKECLKDCEDHILSYDEKICYHDDVSTFKCPLAIHSVKSYTGDKNAKYKCDCPSKFYIESTTNEKVCLSENEECPSGYKFKSDTNECVENCGSGYCQVANLCIRNDGACSEYWNKINENEYQPSQGNSCNNAQKFYEMGDTKICVKNCQNSTYFIFHDNKCISSCSDIPNSELYKIPSSSLGENPLSLYKCRCTNLWYKDSSGKTQCLPSTIKECKENANNDNTEIKNKVKMKLDTNECVTENECTLEFNKGVCFESCNEVKKYFPGFEYREILIGEERKCRCEGLWIDNEGIIECLKDKTCPKEKKYLIDETSECTSNSECSGKIFNNICYKDCSKEKNTKVEGNECVCLNKWYKYKNEFLDFENYIVCLGADENCPSEYPYIKPVNECIESLDSCDKIFNNECYKDSCPTDTIEDPKNPKICICDTENKRWYQYIDNGITFLKCGLDKCKDNKPYFDEETKECLVKCSADKYIYKNTCYKECPGKTKVLDQISKFCEDILVFDEEEKMKTIGDLETKMSNETTIIELYEKTTSVGLVYNIDNSSLQFYGVNKKSEPDQNLIMRSNLTYIDISKCLDTLYKKASNDLRDTDDIVIVKYDIGDVTNSTTINPVEYKLVNSRTGKPIPMTDCGDNSILISYPLSSILNNFPTRNRRKTRKLQESEESITLNLNFKEQFLLGKELYLQDNEIDIFNYENKIYNDMCYPFEIDGKNLILEDRFNYLYPIFTFCESNCIYNNTDFINERINCNCSPKDQVKLDRTFVYKKSEADIQKVKDNQKSTILKCISKISNLSKNFGFFYGLIVILIEIGMILLTLLYSYKVLNMRIKRKYDINGDDKYDINDDDDNDNDNDIENNDLNEKKIEASDKKNKKKLNTGAIKTTERNLKTNPPKKNAFANDKNDKNNNKNTKKKVETPDKKGNTKNIINTKKVNKNIDFEEKISSSDYPSIESEKSSNISLNDMEEESVFSQIKSEEKLLRVGYEVALKKNKSEVLIMIMTEILDKIYFIKSIWLLQTYEIFSLQFSLYVLWHMMMLSFLCFFYDNSMLHKIWTKENYPDMNYYLAFGFVTSLIVFVIYKGATFLINNNLAMKDIESTPRDNTNEISVKYAKMMKCSKIKLAIYYILEFGLIIIFFLYLMTFCYLYSATQSNLVESYGIALIEVVIIKVIYGLILGILRKISLAYEVNKLYSIVKFLDLYIA